MSDVFGVHVPELQLTPAHVRSALALAGLEEGETYVELGSGEGLGLVTAASEFGARAAGVELMPHAIELTHRRARKAGVEVHVTHGDLLQYDPSAADVLLLHLGPAFHDLLAPRLEQVLGPHTRVLACGWLVPGWLPVREPLEHEHPTWLYAPGDPGRHGAWSPTSSERELLPGASGLVDAAVFTAGADLHEVEVRVDGIAAPRLRASIGRSQLGRGQSAHVSLEWDVRDSDPGELVAAVQLHARSRSGRITRRGPALDVLLRQR